MRTVYDCQDKELRYKSGSSPLKFNFSKQMPLLEILRGEVRQLKEQLQEAKRTLSEKELVLLKEHDMWTESSKQEHTALRAKSEALAA